MILDHEGYAGVETDIPPISGLCESFLDFIGENRFPCVGAKSALARGTIEAHELNALGHRDNARALLDGLARFVDMIDETPSDASIVHSFVAIFRGPFDMDERRFETMMWTQLWQIHDIDMQAGNLRAGDVSSDTASPRFSVSLAGHPFFLIGLHPHASRLSRRFTHPVMVFNSHRQFERLKEDGRFEKMQAATRSRDIDLQGSINPNLANFGEASEARQYSGRAVDESWRCPFDFSRTQ